MKDTGTSNVEPGTAKGRRGRRRKGVISLKGRNVVTNTVLPRFFARKVVTKGHNFFGEVVTIAADSSRKGREGRKGAALTTSKRKGVNGFARL
jgi:hypothetical protein